MSSDPTFSIVGESTPPRSAQQRMAIAAAVVGAIFLASAGIWVSPERSEASDSRSNSEPAIPAEAGALTEAAAAVSLPLKMVRLDAGRFQMGSPAGDARSQRFERPLHEVHVPAFEISSFEVTRGQWREVMEVAPAEWTEANDDRLPATHVTWDQARAFCARLSDREGLEGESRYRLPSEAEWEHACRAGTNSGYSFGDDERQLGEYGWFFANSGVEPLHPDTVWQSRKVFGEWGCRLHPVGGKRPNAWGLYDMHGNVWEWCEDTGHAAYDGAPSDGRAWVDDGAITRVARGGCFSETAAGLRSANRFANLPAIASGGFLGFRPVRTYVAPSSGRD